MTSTDVYELWHMNFVILTCLCINV